MKIEYTKVGDYYLPNLYYPEETRPIGLWGMLRKEYLKEHKHRCTRGTNEIK